MAARLSAFLVWACLAASAVFWGLRIGAGSPTTPAHAVPVTASAAPRADLARVLGTDAAPPAAVAGTPAPSPEANRFKLVGLMAPRTASAEGIAVLSVDGAPARPYRIGSTVDGRLVLQSVQPRAVALGPRGGPAEVTLDLPLPAPAATGTLPSTVAPLVPGAAPPSPPVAPVPGTPPQGQAPIGTAPPVVSPGSNVRPAAAR